MIDLMIEDLKAYFPMDWERTIKYWKNSEYELCIKRDDGEIFIYDYADKSIRRMSPNVENITEETFKKEFGIRLSRLMWNKGLTQEELAKRTGMTQSQLSGYITGRVVPSFYKVCKIAEVLGCSTDRLWFVRDTYN